MPVIVSQIKSSLNEDKFSIINKAIKKISIDQNEIEIADIYKTSLDARNNNNIHFVHSVMLTLKNKSDEYILSQKNAYCSFVENTKLDPVIGNVKKNGEIAIIGFGPAGMFAGLVLAENGYKPLIFEKGQAIDERVSSVEDFWKNKKLNTNSNVQFGEGGAGTFSDGKLTTRIKDPLCRYVLEKFVEFGATPDILTKAKPHIGTDNLRKIVKAIRERIIELGGKVYFNSEITDLKIENNILKEISTKDKNIKCQATILSIGHSARNTFKMLLDKGIYIENKPFSVGFRIEHLQEDVDKSLFGKHVGNPFLPHGEYQLSYRNKEGRGVYTFCMCPGGFVVPSSSEENTIVTNGMSEYLRNQKNANSAVVVSVSQKDFGNAPLDGMNFARKIEENAFKIAGSNYCAPITTTGAFLGKNKFAIKNVAPSYSAGVAECNFKDIFPQTIYDMLQIGINNFSTKMNCFKDDNAILTAPETRTSSPVRINRLSDNQSVSTKNLYPCGEGAGYAGGIMSAAVDGINTALKIMQKFSPDDL